MRLYTPATSSWSRLMRSSASQHDIEATPLRILHQDLDPGADKAGAGDRTVVVALHHGPAFRSEEHTSELQSLMRISYAVFCLKKKRKTKYTVQIINRCINISYQT